ncbi:hypothetical protein MMIC_P1370 [Mariprofundus micogutta]|uniref:Uncharacterized protein n=1 Tax=Mariprofundus micogutta TaxID=1921010 RepID=A0A1L8CNB6_9PROT|nr:hypothetical protein MMIC_P1370 [Mariprofundus micogutta]
MSFLKKTFHEMADNSAAVSQSSINGVTYDIPEWLSANF